MKSIFVGVGHFDGRSIIYLAVLILFCTPFLRLLLSLFSFIFRKRQTLHSYHLHCTCDYCDECYIRILTLMFLAYFNFDKDSCDHTRRSPIKKENPERSRKAISCPLDKTENLVIICRVFNLCPEFLV